MGKLPVGVANIEVSFVRTGNRAGRFEMSVNGLMIGSVHVSRTWTIVSGMSGGLTCGFGNIPITDQCIPPAPIHDINVNRVTISVANDSQDDILDYEAFLRDQ